MTNPNLDEALHSCESRARLIAVAALIAVGAAFASGRIRLAIAGVPLFRYCCWVGYWAWRIRRSASEQGSPPSALDQGASKHALKLAARRR